MRFDFKISKGVSKQFQTIDFEKVQENNCARKKGAVGFGHVYLKRCNKESKKGDKIDVEVYSKLVELDARLGTKASEQLYECLARTTRWDIIKV